MKLCEFSNYQWVHDANYGLRSALEHGHFQIAAEPPVAGEVYAPIIEDMSEEINATVNEMSTIVTIELQNRTRWDTPTKGMRKDRYSAVLCGHFAARTILNSLNRPTTLIGGFWA